LSTERNPNTDGSLAFHLANSNQREKDFRDALEVELKRNSVLRSEMEKEVQKTADAYRAQSELIGLVMATHEHLLPLLRLYGEPDGHPVIHAIQNYVASLTNHGAAQRQ
jgi:hypothetical protein